MKDRTVYPWAICLLALLLAISFSPKVLAQPPTGSTANTITLGIISGSHQREIADHFAPFITYVSQKLFATADGRGRVLVASSLPELANLLASKDIDFFMESAYPTYVIDEVHGTAKLLLRRWKGGMAEYRSLIASRKGSGINRIENLRGKMIAFEDPESTSGYFLPKFFLLRNGLKLVPGSITNPSVPAESVAYVFAGTTENLLEMILTKQVAAGSLSDDDFATIDPQKKSALNVLAQTEFLPRHLVSVRKDLPQELAERLMKVLQAMHEDDTGRKILLGADNTTKFDVLPGGDEAMRRRLLDTFYDAPRK